MGPLPRLRVLVCGADGPYLDDLCRVVAAWPAVSVVGTARSVEEAAAMAGDLAPDVVLADLDSPTTGSARAIAALKRLPDAPIVLAITRAGGAAERSAALAAGADGLLSRGDPIERLRELIRTIRVHLAPVPRPALYMSARRD